MLLLQLRYTFLPKRFGAIPLLTRKSVNDWWAWSRTINLLWAICSREITAVTWSGILGSVHGNQSWRRLESVGWGGGTNIEAPCQITPTAILHCWFRHSFVLVGLGSLVTDSASIHSISLTPPASPSKLCLCASPLQSISALLFPMSFYGF